MLFLRIIGIQISNILVSFNKLKELIFERYEKISLSNECAEVMSTKLKKSRFYFRLTRYMHLQSSKMTDRLKDQMPL